MFGVAVRKHLSRSGLDNMHRCPEFLCLFVFFVANKTRAARGLFFSHKETQEDTKSTKNVLPMSLDDYLKRSNLGKWYFCTLPNRPHPGIPDADRTLCSGPSILRATRLLSQQLPADSDLSSVVVPGSDIRCWDLCGRMQTHRGYEENVSGTIQGLRTQVLRQS